jgi:hypothetical protein
MKRNTIATALMLGGMALSYSACNENNLNLQPLTPTEASFFTEEIDYVRSVYGVYAKMQDWYSFNANNPMHGFWQLPGDDITSTGTYAFEIFGTLQPANRDLNNFYRIAYQLINRANTGLQKLDAENGVIRTANLKNHLRGEMLFLRGYTYYLLANYFGTSPLITERIQSTAQTTPPNALEGTLLDQAIADLTEAATLLPATWPTTDRGRVTQNSANGMLGKALVCRASIRRAPADFTAALTAFNKITGVSLVPNFNDNFDVAKENNAESLFEFQASQPSFDNVWLPNDFDNAIGTMSAWWGFYENNPNLFGQAPFIPTQKLIDAFEVGDPRIKSTFDPVKRTFLKYWATGDRKSQSNVASINNSRILRYADVLLLKAEAILESGGPTAEAIGLINQVRTRARTMVAGGTVPANYATTTTDRAQIFNWIMMERFRELAGEDHGRWLDLRRWHLAEKINLGTGFNWSSVRNDLSFNVSRNLVYPIPINEIDLNPNIVQNPGY